MKIHSKRSFFLLAAALLLVASAAMARPALAALLDNADQGGRPFVVHMTGAQEAPGPGDPSGSGVAMITLNQGQGQVCWDLSVSGLTATPIAAHIHIAPVGSPGPIVVPLSPPVDGHSSGCTTADQDLIKAIRQNPQNYYVNVHTTDFPAGAVRGQLSK